VTYCDDFRVKGANFGTRNLSSDAVANVTYSDVFRKQREFAFGKHPLNSILQVSWNFLHFLIATKKVYISINFCNFWVVRRREPVLSIKNPQIAGKG